MSKQQRPTFSIDVQYYQTYLEDSNLSDAEKQELLETLWDIICELVQLGYGVHPMQQLDENCGQDKGDSGKSEKADSSALDSKHGSLIKAFMDACDKDDNQ